MKTSGPKDYPRFTLAEAKRIIRREECTVSGHEYAVLQSSAFIPYMVICRNCGEHWEVAKDGD